MTIVFYRNINLRSEKINETQYCAQKNMFYFLILLKKSV